MHLTVNSFASSQERRIKVLSEKMRIGETLHAASGLYGQSRQPFEGKEEQGERESKDREKERETSLVCASRSGFTHDRPKGEDPGAPPCPPPRSSSPP